LIPELILYGTSACHLCDEALAIVLPIARASGITLRQIDIAADDALETRYGLHIPVIAHNSMELNWPFNAAQVIAFLQAYKD